MKRLRLLAVLAIAGAWVLIGSVAYAESYEAEVRKRIAEILREAEQGDIGMQVALGFAYVRGWGGSAKLCRGAEVVADSRRARGHRGTGEARFPPPR